MTCTICSIICGNIRSCINRAQMHIQNMHIPYIDNFLFSPPVWGERSKPQLQVLTLLKIISAATFLIIGLTKIARIAFLPLDGIYHSLRIMTFTKEGIHNYMLCICRFSGMFTIEIYYSLCFKYHFCYCAISEAYKQSS